MKTEKKRFRLQYQKQTGYWYVIEKSTGIYWGCTKAL